MTQLPLDQSVPRFRENEERMDTMVNGAPTATWVTRDGRELPTLSYLVEEIEALLPPGEVDPAEPDGLWDRVFPEKPDTPTGLTLTSILHANGRVDLRATWNAVSGNTSGYLVTLTEGSGDPVTYFGPTNLVEWRNVPPNSSFSATVQSLNTMGGRSDPSATVGHVSTKDQDEPAVPTGVTPVRGFESIRIDWEDNSEADFSHYEVIQKGTSAAPGQNPVGVRRVVESRFVTTGLETGLTLYTWVRAVDTSGNKSDWTDAVVATVAELGDTQAVPDAPTGLSWTSVLVEDGRAENRLTWNPAVGAAAYNVSVARHPSGAGPNTITVGEEGYTFESVPALQFKVKVQSVGILGIRSEWTNEQIITAARDNNAPDDPTDLEATSGISSIWLRWSHVVPNDFSHYEIFEYNQTGTPDENADADFISTSKTFSRSGLDDDTRKYYRVRAVDTSGNKSGFSNEVNAKTEEDVFQQVAAVAAAANQADLKAQEVRNDHDALVADFVGNLPDAFNSVDQTITATRKNLQAGLSASNEVNTPNANNPENTNSSDVPVGQWSDAIDDADVPVGAPAGARSIKVQDGCREMPPRASTIADRLFKITAWVKTDGSFRPCVRDGSGNILENGSLPFSNNTGWQFKTWHLQVGSSVFGAWCPGWDLANAGENLWFYDLRWEDVTELDASEQAISGSIEEIRGLDINALTGTALGVFLDQMEVQANGLSAKFTQQVAAVAELEGNASVSYVLRLKTGGATGEMEIVAADDATGTPESSFRFFAKYFLFYGSVTTELLSVGFGKNLLADSSFASGIDNWSIFQSGAAGGQSTISIRPAGDNYAGADFPTLMVLQNGLEQSGYADVRCRPIINTDGDRSYGVQVDPGKWYEASCRFSMHRCTGELRIQWYDKDGNTITPYAGPVTIPEGSSYQNEPNRWPQIIVRGKAPANAARATIHARKFGTNSAVTPSSYMFLHKPMLAETVENASEPVPYDIGKTTLITGNGIVTDSILARHIKAGEITADKLNVNDLSAISANLGTIQVGTANIENLAVDSLKLGNGAVLTEKVLDNAITASGADSTNGATPTTSDYTTYATVVLNTHGNRALAVFIDGTANGATGAGGGLGGFLFRLRKNGSTVRSWQWRPQDTFENEFSRAFYLVSTPGTTTLELQLRNQDANTISANVVSIFAMELKK